MGLTASAQTKFGAKLGANYFTLGGDNVEGSDVKGKLGFNAGGQVNIPVSEHFSVQPEAVFSIQGGKLDNVGGVSDNRINYNLNYVNVPIMLQFTSDKGLYGELGPQFGFLVSAKADSKINGTSSDVDIKDALKGFDFGVGVGVGYKFTSGLGVGARYNLGLTNIDEDDDGDLKNRGFQLGLFYSFGGNIKTKK